MKPPSLLSLFLLPLLACVQAQSPIVSTSLTTYITLGSGRVETTVTSGVLFTITPSSQPASSTGGVHSGSGSGTLPAQSGGVNGTSVAVSSTRSTPFPTAPTSGVDGGGTAGPNGGAPVPGATGAGGIYGPDDGYTSAVLGLNVNILLSSVVGTVVGGVLVFV